MKRLFALCLLALLALNSLAQTIIPEEAVSVYLTEPVPKDKPKGHKAPARRPAMFYLDNYIYLQSPYNIDVAQIIFRDADDNILYNTITSLTSGVNTIVLPLDVVSEMESVEFIYSDHDLWGYFY